MTFIRRIPHKKKVVVMLLILSVVFNILQFSINNKQQKVTDKYPLLSSRIALNQENDYLIRFLDLRNKLRERFLPLGENFALYFEYLPTGVSIGINEKLEVSPASLIKVPLAMAYYNGLEDGSIAPNQTLTLTQQDLDTSFGTLWQKGAGYQLTASDTIKIMLEDSDNTAMLLLSRTIPANAYEDVYNGLDLTYQDNNKFIVTAKGYSSILKSLYFSSILNNPDSQLLLNYLAHATGSYLLPAGVPKNITVAHKIGINQKENTYQDCGIVYIPKRRYILCIISKSEEITATKLISEASKIVYDYVSTVSAPPTPGLEVNQ